MHVPARAQRGNHYMDVGGGLGVTSYTGDLNMSAVPSTVLGHGMGIFRYAFSELYAIRFNLLGGLYTATYNPERYYLPVHAEAQTLDGGTFLHIGGDVSAEIHLRKYQVGHFTHTRFNRTNWTPYISVGIGGMFIPSAGASFYLPMGGGVKFALGGRWTLAPEIRFAKLFTDGADGYANWPLEDSGGAFHNRDWISMVSFTVTYRLYTNVPTCPAYIETE